MRSCSRKVLACAALVALAASPALADVYMQNPRGSNNRLNEQTATRDNNNRMFDSQNNARGGYNVGDRGYKAANTAASNNYGVADPAATYNTDNTANLDTDAAKIQYQMVYYEGSEVSVSWTNQHGCGGNEASDPQKLNCDLILQYMCQTTNGQLVNGNLPATPAGLIPGAEVLRDGANTGSPGTINSYADISAIATNLDNGHHESEYYYYACSKRSRNRGLFTADQGVGNAATNTRQNPGGGRSGLECSEERDYYPYWSPSPWKDIVVLTDHAGDKCDASGTFKGLSQNNNVVSMCLPPPQASGESNNDYATRAAVQLGPITQQACNTTKVNNVLAPGVWTTYTHNIAAPKCQQNEWSRVNHLGNGRTGQPLGYNWTLPTMADLTSQGVYIYPATAQGVTTTYAKCILRLRYNISTDDYDPSTTDYTFNGNTNRNQYGKISPVTNNPIVDVGAAADGYDGLRLNVNTAQFGRTFQDRSHVFYIRARPASIPASAKIYNLNVRGKRGNIVQTFPATEYDFHPSRLEVTPADFVHVQWTGSNTHNNGGGGGDGQAGDAGEGTDGTDRHNMAQLLAFGQNYPIALDKTPDNMWSRSTCYKLDGSKLSSSAASTFSDLSGSSNLDCAVYITTSGQFRSAAEANAAAAATTKTDQNTFDPLLDFAPASLVGGVVMQFDRVSPAAGAPVSYDYMCTRNNNFSNRGQKATIVVKAA